jgi:mannose-6-phosphate isomerase-like protein (cupin superfamily)
MGNALKQKNLRIGVQLRHARKLKGLRLRELADAVGCSESLLSKLENDKAQPSLQMLHNIVTELDTTIGALFAHDYDRDHIVMRADQRPRLQMNSEQKADGVRLECLIPYPDSKLLYGSIHVVEPGGGSEGMIEHRGEEVGYILEGELELIVENKTYKLSAGDSFFFDSQLPHGYRNTGKVTTRVLWINTPPTF